jgi:hypothetical protein
MLLVKNHRELYQLSQLQIGFHLFAKSGKKLSLLEMCLNNVETRVSHQIEFSEYDDHFQSIINLLIYPEI